MEQKHIFKAFLYFYKLHYNQSMIYSDKSQEQCFKYINMLEKQYFSIQRLGEDFLWTYFIYQFDYWSKLDIKSYNGKINLSMIVGKKAFQRFVDRDSQFDWQILENARTYSRKDFNQIVSLVRVQEIEKKFDPDERYRKTLLNTERGLSNCIVYTSLHSNISKSCNKCIFTESCLTVQKQLYPRIYKDRKIENGTNQTAAGQ